MSRRLACPLQADASPAVALAAVLLAIVFGAAGAATPVRAQAGPEPTPVWPLDLPTRHLTSNFMEHRLGRFHAGIDLKTGGRCGLPVRAAEDGWISRLRVAPFGYGWVVYLRGDSGRTYVYAHLERLADPWRELVRADLRRRGASEADLVLAPGAHRVRRGEVLALSGQSGTLGPHLHFEVRDADNLPLDPLAWGFAPPDTIAPAILAVRCLPAAPDVRVAGTAGARLFETGAPLAGMLPPLTVDGPVAFTARVNETADVAGHRLEPWRLTVTLDDSLVLEARNDVFDLSTQAYMRLEWLQLPGGRERWLMRREGNRLAGRRGGEWSRDPAVLAPGDHVVRLRVEDRTGNAGEVAWRLTVVEAGAEAPTGAGWRSAPVETVGDVPGSRLTPFCASGPTGDAAVPPGPYAAVPGRLSPAEVSRAQRSQGLVHLGWALDVRSPDWCRSEPVTLPLAAGRLDTLPAGVGLYIDRGDETWGRVGSPQRVGALWTVGIAGPGRYALFADRTPPYLGPGPAEGVVGPGPAVVDPAVTPPRWEVLALPLDDRGSGVDPATVSVELDGVALTPEPDPLRDRLLVELPDDLAAGPHRLAVAARDRAGLAVERVYRLDLRP